MSLRSVVTPKESVLIVWDVQKGLVRSIFNREEFLRGLNNVLEWQDGLGFQQCSLR
jgi:hypothetical protein